MKRTALLLVAHQGAVTRPKPRNACANYGRWGLDSLDGCTCKPSYLTYHRDSAGRPVRGARTRNRRDAERQLERLQQELDGGNAPQRPKRMPFPQWVVEYRAMLEKRVDRGKLKARTLRDYTETLDRAVDAIGHTDLREIGPRDLERFVDSYGDKVSEATIGRALRELGACLTEAVDAGHLERNPVRSFKKKLELDPAGRGKDPFTDEELAKLWTVLARPVPSGGRTPAEHEKGGADPIYLHLFRIAVATGARLGELLALDWDDVSLSEGRLSIRHTYNDVDGLTAPKTKGSARTVFLLATASREFEAMAAKRSTGPVFVGPRGERLNQRYVGVVLERARQAAGIPKLGESGLPRSFHSFRSTFDRRALEQGLHPEFVRATLGHASLELTLNHYGTWSEKAMLEQAAKATEAL